MIPKLTVPTYEVTLPSNGKKVKIRPFLVKEEKILLMAIESNDNEEIIKTTIDTIQGCIQTKGIKVENLPFFDVDYLFIALRAKSVGESIDVKFQCNALIDNRSVCGNEFKSAIDISNCSIRKNEAIGTTIDLGQGLSVTLHYPSYAEMRRANENVEENAFDLSILSMCIDMMVQGENVYTRKDFETEISEFLGNLTKDQYSRLVRWVENLPTFYVKAEAKCDRCGFDHKLEYTEFESFFD